MNALAEVLPPHLAGLVLTLAISLLIGFEREELRPTREGSFFGGVRTFPLIALTGFLLYLGFPDSAVPFSVGLIMVGVLLAISHHASIENQSVGITTEVAALVTYALGGAAADGAYWIVVASGIVTVILLQEKQRLEGLALKVPRQEVSTLVRFLLLTGVILPVVPNHTFTAFEINPFKIWLVVVAVSGVSYLSYLLQLRLSGHHGLLVTGLAGGAYSSTATTVVLARKSRHDKHRSTAVAGAVLAASGVMYIRVWILVLLFAPLLASRLSWLFWGLGLAAAGVGALLVQRSPGDGENAEGSTPSGNPLELSSAFIFAAIFLVVLVITRLVAQQFGGTGLLIFAGVMGAADVDPFILGLTQYLGHGLDASTAALAIVVATAANNVMKGIYAVVFGDRRAGVEAFALLAATAAASVLLFLVF